MSQEGLPEEVSGQGLQGDPSLDGREEEEKEEGVEEEEEERVQGARVSMAHAHPTPIRPPPCSTLATVLRGAVSGGWPPRRSCRVCT